MGQQDVPDEVMLRRAEESAERLLEHLRRYAAGSQGEGPSADAATAAPTGELESAVTSLRNLIAALQKESQRR